MKELKKGNKAPYKGYLLNQKEYKKYQKTKEVLPLIQQEIQEIKQNRIPKWKPW